MIYNKIVDSACLLRSVDTSQRDKALSLKEGGMKNNKPQVPYVKTSSKNSSSASIPTSTRPRKREIGPTLQRGKLLLILREYNYDVILKGIGYSIMFSNLFLTWRIFVNKKMVFWPLALIPVSYVFISPMYLFPDIVSSRSTAKKYSICVILVNNIISAEEETKCLDSVMASSMLRISDWHHHNH